MVLFFRDLLEKFICTSTKKALMANVFLAIVGVICAVIVLIQVVSLVLVKSRSLCGSSVYVIRNSRIVSTDC